MSNDNPEPERIQPLSFHSFSKLAIVEDSQGDDSEYDYEQDFARFKTRQEIFKLEMERHSQTFSQLKPKKNENKRKIKERQRNAEQDDYFQPQSRQKISRRQSSSSLSSLTSLSASIQDSSDDDILSFLKRDKTPGLKVSEATKPRLTIAEILEQTKKNKARDLEIRRAQQLLEESESTVLSALDAPVASKIDTYLKPSGGDHSLLGLLNSHPTNSETLTRSFLFFNTNVNDTESAGFNHGTLSALWGPVIESVCGSNIKLLLNCESL
ncbi:hypothetical protein AA313_de0205001 [Arthrobotrys entomopaga]|nr:hypothetical protein AA313_de0205001 [Arthrobotrys entomopaga]